MFRSYGKNWILIYLTSMGLLNLSYMYVVYINNKQGITSQTLNAVFNILFVFGLLFIYYKNRRFVYRPIIIQSILTQLTLLVGLFTLDYALSGPMHIPFEHLHAFFLTPVVFMVMALAYAAFALLFANLINYVHNFYSREK